MSEPRKYQNKKYAEEIKSLYPYPVQNSKEVALWIYKQGLTKNKDFYAIGAWNSALDYAILKEYNLPSSYFKEHDYVMGHKVTEETPISYIMFKDEETATLCILSTSG